MFHGRWPDGTGARELPGFPAAPRGPLPAAPLPVALFPPTPPDPLAPNPKMQTALTRAIADAERAAGLRAGTLPVRFTIVDLTAPAGLLPSAGHLERETDYIASEAKVSVMYAAYVLRDLVRRFVAGRSALSGDLLAIASRLMNAAIAAASPNIARSLVQAVHRVPSFRAVLAVTPGLRGVNVSFTPQYDKALEGMIVPSNNIAAATCVHGLGYGYLNGSLAAGGFFDTSTSRGLWVAGDFLGGRQWPYVRIVSRNDGFVAQAGTTRAMATLVSLLMTDRLGLDAQSGDEMRGRLARAAKGIDTPWVARTSVFRSGAITHNKLGLGPLKSGQNVRSEVSVYQSPVASGRRYVVAWQNLIGLTPLGFTHVARIIRNTIAEYER